MGEARESGARRPFVWLIPIAALVSLLGWFIFARKGTPGLSDRELATQIMAEHLRAVLKPKAVLVISNPFPQLPGRPAEVYEFERAGVAGLRRGFGPQVELKVVFPKLKAEVLNDPGSVPIDPKTTTPLSFLVSAEAFEATIRENPNCEVVISLIGLPVSLDRVEAWSKAPPPRFALLLPDCRMIGDLTAVQTAFTSGKVAAAVLRKPETPARKAGSGNYQQQFEDRFLLVTTENASALLSKHPRLFGF